MGNFLEFRNVTYTYQNHKKQYISLKNISYSFDKGKIYGIVGSDDSGKIATIILAGGLDKPTYGKVIYKGNDVTKIGLSKYRRNDSAIIFKSSNLIYYLNAYENIVVALKIANIKIKDKKKYCLNLLETFGLSKKQCFENISNLSANLQQRVALARAIVKNTDLILADEPTGNLNEKESQVFLNDLITLAHQGRCIIISTHSPSLAAKCDVQLRIQNGQIFEI